MLNALITIGGLQFLTMLALLVRTKALALMLGPNGVGVLSTVDKLTATVAQTVSLSLPFAALRFLPELWNEDREEFVTVLRQMRNLLVVVAVLTLTGALVITKFSPQFWGKELLPYEPIILCAFLTLPVVILVPFLQSVIAGRLTHNLSMFFTFGHAVVLALAAIVGVWWMGLSGFYVLYAIAGLLLVLPVLRYVEQIPGQNTKPKSRRFSIRLPQRILKFGLALWGLAFVAPFAALYVNYQVLAIFGSGVAGWMQAAMGVGLAARTLLGSAHQLYLTPNMNKGGSLTERMWWTGEFQKTFSFVCAVAVLPLLLFPRIVVALLYSSKFLPAAGFVALFVGAEVLTLLVGTYQVLIVAFNHTGFHVFQNLVAQGALLLVAHLLIKPYGILGAGLAIISPQIVLYIGTTLFLWYKYKLKIPTRGNLLSLYIILSLGAAGVVGALDTNFSWGMTLFKIALYAALTAGLGLFLTSKDRGNVFRLGRQAWDRFQSLGFPVSKNIVRE